MILWYYVTLSFNDEEWCNNKQLISIKICRSIFEHLRRRYMLADSHCHLNMEYFKDDYVEIAERAYKTGVRLIVAIGTNYNDSKRGVEIANEIDYVYTSIGWHPHDTKDIKTLKNLLKITDLANHKKVVAYGEIGLDFFKNYSPQDIQKKFFRYQINVAKELKLPIIIHDRNAHEEVLKILKEENAALVGGVIHCFSGDAEYAKQVMDLGFFISFPGTITFKNNKSEAKKIIASIPADRILIETDSPFLTPVPHRGKRNEPAFVRHVAETIAEFKGISFDEIAEITYNNCKRVFNIKSA
jgi:TatD DNase family protein